MGCQTASFLSREPHGHASARLAATSVWGPEEECGAPGTAELTGDARVSLPVPPPALG